MRETRRGVRGTIGLVWGEELHSTRERGEQTSVMIGNQLGAYVHVEEGNGGGTLGDAAGPWRDVTSG